VGHTSTPFSEDTEDLVSMLYRPCSDISAYGVEEAVRHHGADIVLLCVSPIPPVYFSIRTYMQLDLSKSRIVAVMLPPTFALSVFIMAATTLLLGTSSSDTNTIDS